MLLRSSLNHRVRSAAASSAPSPRALPLAHPVRETAHEPLANIEASDAQGLRPGGRAAPSVPARRAICRDSRSRTASNGLDL
jgi:hypothetical protein